MESFHFWSSTERLCGGRKDRLWKLVLRGASSGGENEWEEKDVHQLLPQDKLSLAVVAGRRLEGTKEIC